jgi:hypothetical protein
MRELIECIEMAEQLDNAYFKNKLTRVLMRLGLSSVVPSQMNTIELREVIYELSTAMKHDLKYKVVSLSTGLQYKLPTDRLIDYTNELNSRL